VLVMRSSRGVEGENHQGLLPAAAAQAAALAEQQREAQKAAARLPPPPPPRRNSISTFTWYSRSAAR